MDRNRRTIKVFTITLLAMLLICSGFLFALRPEIQAMIDAYNAGDTAGSSSLLNTITPENPDEAAVVLYYKAQLTTDADNAKALLQSLVDNHPRHPLAQKALLELGKIFLLDRDYTKALAAFSQVTDPNLDDKHYWIANVYFEKGDYTNAIASANQFLRVSHDTRQTEEISFLLADSYISLEQYNNAINTLKKLLAKPENIQDEQYLRYRYGFAAEMLDSRAEALSQYKLGYEVNRFSQLAYQIEDRLFEMRDRFGSVIDLSFLYPYASGPLPDIVVAEQNELNRQNETDNPDTTKTSDPLPPHEINPADQKGIYLQAGRFSSQNNALKLCDRISKLKLNAQYYKSTQFQDVSWVVISGPYPAEIDAVNAKTLLRENGIDSFIIQK